MGQGRGWVGFSLMIVAVGLAIGMFFGPWMTQSVDTTTCFSPGDCSSNTLDAEYSVSGLEMTDGSETVSSNWQAQQIDDENILSKDNQKGVGLVKAATLIAFFAAITLAIAAITALVGLLTSSRATTAAMVIGIIATIGLTAASITLVTGIGQFNAAWLETLAVESSDPNYVKGDAADAGMMLPHFGAILGFIALVAGGTGSVLLRTTSNDIAMDVRPEPAGDMAPPAAMRKLSCPRCKHQFALAAGTRPKCPSCNFA